MKDLPEISIREPKDIKKLTEDFHPRAKKYEKPGKDSYPRVSMKQIPDKF